MAGGGMQGLLGRKKHSHSLWICLKIDIMAIVISCPLRVRSPSRKQGQRKERTWGQVTPLEL
jgi:hypothetical protein